MKMIYFVMLMFFCSSVKAQKYEYKFRIDNINNLSGAKMVTDLLRNVFIVYPNFNDSTDYFEFRSDFYMSESDLGAYLSEDGYSLLYFNRIETNAIKEEKE